MASDPKEIWLEPACCADPHSGRMWAEDNPFPECDDGVQPTRYVRADLAALSASPAPAPSDLVERVADALEVAEMNFSYQTTMTSLVDGIVTYRLQIGDAVESFTDNDEAYACDQYGERIRQVKYDHLARAVIAAMQSVGTISIPLATYDALVEGYPGDPALIAAMQPVDHIGDANEMIAPASPEVGS